MRKSLVILLLALGAAFVMPSVAKAPDVEKVCVVQAVHETAVQPAAFDVLYVFDAQTSTQAHPSIQLVNDVPLQKADLIKPDVLTIAVLRSWQSVKGYTNNYEKPPCTDNSLALLQPSQFY